MHARRARAHVGPSVVSKAKKDVFARLMSSTDPTASILSADGGCSLAAAAAAYTAQEAEVRGKWERADHAFARD